MAGIVYEVRVRGDVTERVRDVFEHASVTTESVVRADLPDQAALHGVIAWIDRLSVELIALRHAERRVERRSR